MTDINHIADAAVTAAMNAASDAAEQAGAMVRRVIVIVTVDDVDDENENCLAIAGNDPSDIDAEAALQTLLGHARVLADEAGGELRIFGLPERRHG
jgi:hypothetical protein